MADEPATSKPESSLEQAANDRLKECRQGKGPWLPDFKEAYFFTAPQRQRQVSSSGMTSPIGRMKDEAELNTSLPALLAQDFVTEVVNTYMPEAQQWCERGRGMFLDEDGWGKIKDQVGKDDKQVFSAMKSSNLYAELQKIFFPDLAIGTCAMWVRRMNSFGPISVMAIPLRELECALGPDGDIDDRWVVRFTKNCYVKALLPGLTLPKEVERAIDDNPAGKTEIRWGFWRLWERQDDECWQGVVMIKDKMVHDEVLVGEGSCPMIVPRFNPSPDWAWGLGPVLQNLPEFRQIDEIEMQRVRNMELHLTPPFSFPDDSFAAIEQGLEAGYGYPIRRGGGDDIKKIYEPGEPNSANYLYEDKEHRLRKAFYVDLPEQSGDTPPTLGQWLDEMARAQRRIGTPGSPFYREGPAKIFLRFKYLLEQAGTIAPVKVDGKAVSLLPYNPAQRAAEQQEIATAAQFMQMMAGTFPEEFKMVVDGRMTMAAFISKMRVSGLIKVRDEKQVQQFIGQASQLLQGQAGATPGAVPAQPQAPA